MCTITCHHDFKVKGCGTDGRPCIRHCGSDGAWTATPPKCAPLLPGKADGLNITTLGATRVMLTWHNSTHHAPGDGPARVWAVHKESTVTHHPFPPEEAAKACFTSPCRHISEGLKPGGKYTFYVQGDNHAGLGPRSDSVTVTMPLKELGDTHATEL